MGYRMVDDDLSKSFYLFLLRIFDVNMVEIPINEHLGSD